MTDASWVCHDHRAAMGAAPGEGRAMAGFRGAKCGKVAMGQKMCCGRPMKKA
jgi:hypothetical protein